MCVYSQVAQLASESINDIVPLLSSYKVLHGAAPTYLTEPVRTVVPARTLRSGHRHLLDVPHTRRPFHLTLLWKGQTVNCLTFQAAAALIALEQACSPDPRGEPLVQSPVCAG